MEETREVAVIPYHSTVSAQIGGMLRRVNIRTVFCLLLKVYQLMNPVKCLLGLTVCGVYLISCTCGQCYIGQTGHTMVVRCKEHE